MPRRLFLLDEARAEARSGVLYYLQEADDVMVAVRFEAAIERALDAIREIPERWPITDEPSRTRRYLLNRPYNDWLLVYRADPTEVRVLAVMHGRREPGYWRGRR